MSKLCQSIDKILCYIDKHGLLLWALCLVFGSVSLAFVASSTSPLIGYDGADSAVFRTVGKGLAYGYIPYADLFDHKGFIVYLINLIGFLLGPGKIGIFIVEALFFATVLWLGFKICRLFLKPGQSLIIILLLAVFYLVMSEGGNCTEEWSALFTLLPIYLGLKFIVQYGGRGSIDAHPHLYSYIYGLCFGVQLMIRANNAIPLCGLILAFTIQFITEKKWKSLLQNALFVIIGIATITIPILLFFVTQGSFEEFLYGNIVFNLSYSKLGNSINEQGISFIISNSIHIIIFVVAWAIVYHRRLLDKTVLIFIMCIGVFSALPLILSNKYLHYWMLTMPTFLLALCLVFVIYNYSRKKLVNGSAVMLLLLAICTILLIAYKLFDDVVPLIRYNMSFLRGETAAVREIKDIATQIPEEYKDSVWVYELWPHLYLETDIMPYRGTRYFILQSFFSTIDENISNSIQQMLRENPPKYIVTSAENVEDAENEWSPQKYTLQYESENGLELFRLVEE